MNMKYALSSILLCFSLFCLPSCNDNETPANTPDGEEVEEVIKSYDWQLEGKWEYTSNNGNDFSRTLVFEKDGKGSYDDGTLEWYCSNNHLYIDFDNGKSIKDCDYLFYGATLQLKSPQLSYILDCPFIGSWLATDAHNHFTGSTFYYTFAADGNAECFTFNTSGIWESQKYSWLRTQDGIQLLSNMATKNLIWEADAEKFDEELSQILPEKDPSEIPFLNLCYTQPNAQVTAMATQGGYTWSYVDEDGNGQNVVADSAFILEWTELNDLNTANDEGKTDLELVFSEEPDSVTAERWPAEDRGQNFGNGYPEGESVSVEHAESWSIPGAEAGYIYEVDAVFENGTVSYGFEVKK